MIELIRTVSILFLFIVSSAIAKPSIYIAAITIPASDSLCVPVSAKTISDTVSKYLGMYYPVDGSSDSSLTLEINKTIAGNDPISSKLTTLDIKQNYVMIISGCLKTIFTTAKGWKGKVPVLVPGGFVFDVNINIQDTEPEYHYTLYLDYSVYNVSTGKLAVNWRDSDDTQNDSAQCIHCVTSMISNIGDEIYRRLNVQNPFFLFSGINGDLAYTLGGSKPKGGGLGITLKTYYKRIGLNITYDKLFLNDASMILRRFYIGPLIGKKVYSTHRVFDIIFPNGSLGYSFVDYSFSDSKERNTTLHFFSGKVGCMLVFKGFPISLDPSMNLSVGNGKLLAIPSLSLGYTYDYKLVH